MIITFETKEEFIAFKELGKRVRIPVDVAFKCTENDPTIRVNPSVVTSYEAAALDRMVGTKIVPTVVHEKIMDVLRMLPKGTFRK